MPVADDQSTPRLTAVAVLGFVLITPPLVTIFDRGGQVFGVPVIWVYLFLAWAAVITLIAVTVRGAG
jgi:hypothetical protein